jgi:hypothetical protein
MKKITFYCEFCQSEFSVDAALAGRKARCRRCDRTMRIPDRDAVRQTSAVAAAAARVAAGARRTGAGAAVAGRSMNWLDAVSQIQLKPGTVVAKSPAVRRVLDAPEDSVTSYHIAVPSEQRFQNVVKKRVSAKARELKEAGARSNYQFFNMISRLLRRINDATYGISLVFLIVTVVGAIMEKHAIVVFGISMIVLLNIAGLAAGVANLITINFRRNPIRGLLFLIPPVTVYYLVQDSSKWSKPLGRILTPAVTLALVIGAYKYIPWLNGTKGGSVNWSQTVDKIQEDVSGSMSQAREKLNQLKGQVPQELKQVDLEDLKKQATEAVGDVTDKLKKATNTGEPKSSAPDTPERK